MISATSGSMWSWWFVEENIVSLSERRNNSRIIKKTSFNLKQNMSGTFFYRSTFERVPYKISNWRKPPSEGFYCVFQCIEKVPLETFTTCFNPSLPNPGQREKNKLNFIFTLFCGASKGFMKALKCENKNLTYFFQYNFQKCTRRSGLR